MTNFTSHEHKNPTVSATAGQRRRHRTTEEHHQALLPGLPDDVAHLCLSLVPPSTLYSVCRSWRRLIYSPSFPPFFSLYALLLSSDHQVSNSIHFSSFDPISRKWQPLPPPPPDPPLRLLLRHPSFISRKLTVQSISVAGNLVLLAATDDKFLPALSRPLVFNPLTRKWAHGPPMSAPRRWCSAGASRGALYVASGIGAHYDVDVARSVEKWEVDILERRRFPPPRTAARRRWRWEKMGGLRDGRFCREAIEAAGWRGKLCMVNVKGDAAKEGIIYDVERDSWEEMPKGMVAGWKGPAAAMAEETIYAVDESKGVLKRYDHVSDAWVNVVENRGVLRGAQQVAAEGGRVCVLRADGLGIAVLDVAAPPPVRMWTVDAPAGFQAVGIHILPRLSHLDI